MPKYNNVTPVNAYLAWYRDNTTHVSAYGTMPTTVGEAGTTYTLGTLHYGTASWTIATGDAANSRKITAGAASIPTTAAGTVIGFMFFNAGSLTIGGTCAPTAVSSGGTIVMNAFDADEVGTIS